MPDSERGLFGNGISFAAAKKRGLRWGVIIVPTAIFVFLIIISSLTGLDKGIKWLSDKNAWLFIALLVLVFIVGLSFVTLADSMTSTVSLMSIKNNEGVKEAPAGIKLGWGLLMGATSFIFVLNGGLDGIKVVKTIAGFPILFVEIAIVITFLIYILRRSSTGRFKYEAAGLMPDEADKAVAENKLIQLEGV
jgi:choline-glycine betaine transporter